MATEKIFLNIYLRITILFEATFTHLSKIEGSGAGSGRFKIIRILAFTFCLVDRDQRYFDDAQSVWHKKLKKGDEILQDLFIKKTVSEILSSGCFHFGFFSS
jgi:hypothetical protein